MREKRRKDAINLATPTKTDDDTFEELLRRAVIEFTYWEAERVPPKEEIEKTYTMSARHKERMEKLCLGTSQKEPSK